MSPAAAANSNNLTIIVGGGPAGAACALWLHQLGCPALLLESRKQLGGLQRYSPYENVWVPSVTGRRGQDIADHLHDQITRSGVPLRTDMPVHEIACQEGNGFAVHTRDQSLTCGFLVLATGARFRSGGFQDSASVAIGPGSSIEAIDVAGKRVAVLGGGDNAFDQYVFAKARGAKICRIFARNLRAQKKLQAQVPQNDVVIGAYVADQDTMQVNGASFDIFSIQYGFEPVVPDGLKGLARHPDGFVVADHWGVTNLDGLYAIGETAQTFHPCVTTSFAHGIQTAKHIQRRLGL